MASRARSRRCATARASCPAGSSIPDVEAAIAAASGGGQPLRHAASPSASAAAYGQSLGDVRVHNDEHAAALSRAVSARAFTVGSDIFFGRASTGRTRPAGVELLAHELAHVVQQRGAPNTGPLMVSQPGDTLEREAEAAARNFG